MLREKETAGVNQSIQRLNYARSVSPRDLLYSTAFIVIITLLVFFYIHKIYFTLKVTVKNFTQEAIRM